jgi:hypothetical protein
MKQKHKKKTQKEIQQHKSEKKKKKQEGRTLSRCISGLRNKRMEKMR